MRLSFKLALVMVLCTSVILLVYSLARVQREERLFVEDTGRDHRTIGRTLGAVISRAWPTSSSQDVLSMVEHINRKNFRIQIRWIPSSHVTHPSELPASMSVVQDAAPGHGPSVRSLVPVEVAGRVVGWIELHEVLSDLPGYIRGTILRTLVLAILLALTSALLTLAVGYLVVGRPARRLVDKARRVGGGDFSGDLVLRQRDELGVLAREMNAMSAALAAARERVDEETASRLAALEQLRHADRLMSVGQLAAGIAHELGTPLNVVCGRARMIQDGDLTGEETVDSAGIIVSQGQRMAAIIRQLLDFARRRSAEKTRCDLGSLVAETIALMSTTARKRGVTIAFSQPSLPITALVDLAQIQQVLTNLMLNAVQAMADGGTLSVRLERRVRRPAAPMRGQEQACVCIEVEDQGRGIDPEHLQRIFEPFFTTKQVGEGTGLGLSVSYGIIQEHGGWIEVASRPDEGSCFSVYLPEENKEQK